MVDIKRFLLNKKTRIVFCTGAGASQESGIPTFRNQKDSLWNIHNAYKVSSNRALEEDPEKLNEFYNERREKLDQVSPNAFHHYVAKIQKQFGADSVFLMTTNVDDLHERADTEQVYKIHGNLREIVTFEGEVKDIGYRSLKGEDLFSCRPNVVMFGEMYYRTQQGKLFNPYPTVEKIIGSLRKDDLLFIVGGSGIIVDFANIAMLNEHNPQVCIVDPSPDINKIVRSGREVLLNMSACNSIKEIEKIIKEGKIK